MKVTVDGKRYLKVFSTAKKVRRHFVMENGVEKYL